MHISVYILFYPYSDDSRRVPPLTIKDMSARHPPPQKLLFSATLSEDPEKLQQLGLFQPRLFTSIVNKTNSGTVLFVFCL